MVEAEILADRAMYGAWPSAQSDVLLVGTEYHLGTTRFFQYIMSIFAAFANEACVLGRSGIWTADRIDREARQCLRLTAIEARNKYSGRADLHIPKVTDEVGNIDRPVMEHLETYPEWQRFQSKLLEVAKAHSQARNVGAPLSTAANDSHSGQASGGGSQALEKPGSSDKPRTTEGIKAPAIPGDPFRLAPSPPQGIVEEAMAERPVLPPETRAAIERAVGKVLS